MSRFLRLAARAIPVLAIVVGLALAGCGSDSGGGSTGGSTDSATKSPSTGSGTGAADLDAARALSEAGVEGKMSLASEGGARWEGPDSSPPPKEGVTVGIMPCPLTAEACQTLGAAGEEAAKAIGWDSFLIDGKGDPALEQAGVDAAINRGANCIITLAAPARDIKAQIQRAKGKGIKTVVGFSDDPVPFGGDVGFGLDYAEAGAMLAAYVIAHGGGNVVVFNAPQDPQLSVRINGFVDYLKAHGGENAKVVHTEDFALTQIGPGEVQKMRAVLTRFPKGQVDWVIAPFDATLTPLMETARQQGRGEIKGLSFDGDQSAYNDIRQGGEGRQVATISWGLRWVAWAAIDECNRALQGAPVGVHRDFPIELTDASNVPDQGREYEPEFDYRAQFEQMWAAARKG